MKTEIRFKTKREFIEAVMSGKKFKTTKYGGLYYYNENQWNPFRFNNENMNGSWAHILNADFIEIEAEPILEKRWRVMKDYKEYTFCSQYYYNQKALDEDYKESEGYYKGNMIEVEVPQDA